MSIKFSNYFRVIRMKEEDYGENYYKIIDKVSNRFCYVSSTTKLNHLLIILLRCLHEGHYKPTNNLSINRKVQQIFLDKDMAKENKEEYTNGLRLKKLKSNMNTHLEWKCVNEYLEKRKWYIDYSKAE